MSNTKPTFQVDQKIVYPSQGVGKIIEIKERKFKDTMILYYVIYLEVSDMTVLVPVSRSEELGIRAIVSAEEAQKALDMIGEEFEPVTTDWKLRYQMNLDLLKKGSVQDIASIVRCLYHRSKIKELPILERKLYDSAKKLLEDEISFALSKSVKEVEALIHAKLEPLGLAKDSKVSSNDDDDFDDENSEFMDDEDVGAVDDMEEDDDDDGDEE
ncbi:MAG: CarD family transcriptional regulator [Treponemataceae bacterium]|nr:CarD family transcriptional regulator [Treponemataceae bacterium]